MRSRTVTYVIKTSKLCNLRCAYCYEFAELAKHDRMPPAGLTYLFENIASYYHERDTNEDARTKVIFVWHGGEPLLVEPEYYWNAFADQARIFQDRVTYANSVQTNLTVLDDERIRLLRDGFNQVGVSVDLFGGHRVNIAGRDLQDQVLDNMERLRAAGIRFGCITVLHRGNIDSLDRIWRFYEYAGIPFRVLPLFDGADPAQNRPLELSADEIVTALCRLADLWLASDRPVEVLPLSTYSHSLMRHLNPDPAVKAYYDKRDWCWAILVNTNGDLYTDADPYGQPAWCLGNIFTTPLAEIFTGDVWRRSVGLTEERIAANCLSCPYFGGCDGLHIGDHMDNIYERREDGMPVCRLDREVIAHLEARLNDAGLVAPDGRLQMSAAPA